MFQLWATKSSDGKNFLIKESVNEAEINEIQTLINKAIEQGEFLADIRDVR